MQEFGWFFVCIHSSSAFALLNIGVPGGVPPSVRAPQMPWASRACCTVRPQAGRSSFCCRRSSVPWYVLEYVHVYVRTYVCTALQHLCACVPCMWFLGKKLTLAHQGSYSGVRLSDKPNITNLPKAPLICTAVQTDGRTGLQSQVHRQRKYWYLSIHCPR